MRFCDGCSVLWVEDLPRALPRLRTAIRAFMLRNGNLQSLIVTHFHELSSTARLDEKFHFHGAGYTLDRLLQLAYRELHSPRLFAEVTARVGWEDPAFPGLHSAVMRVSQGHTVAFASIIAEQPSSVSKFIQNTILSVALRTGALHFKSNALDENIKLIRSAGSEIGLPAILAAFEEIRSTEGRELVRSRGEHKKAPSTAEIDRREVAKLIYAERWNLKLAESIQLDLAVFLYQYERAWLLGKAGFDRMAGIVAKWDRTSGSVKDGMPGDDERALSALGQCFRDEQRSALSQPQMLLAEQVLKSPESFGSRESAASATAAVVKRLATAPASQGALLLEGWLEREHAFTSGIGFDTYALAVGALIGAGRTRAQGLASFFQSYTARPSAHDPIINRHLSSYLADRLRAAPIAENELLIALSALANSFSADDIDYQRVADLLSPLCDTRYVSLYRELACYFYGQPVGQRASIALQALGEEFMPTSLEILANQLVHEYKYCLAHKPYLPVVLAARLGVPSLASIMAAMLSRGGNLLSTYPKEVGEALFLAAKEPNEPLVQTLLAQTVEGTRTSRPRSSESRDLLDMDRREKLDFDNSDLSLRRMRLNALRQSIKNSVSTISDSCLLRLSSQVDVYLDHHYHIVERFGGTIEQEFSGTVCFRIDFSDVRNAADGERRRRNAA